MTLPALPEGFTWRVTKTHGCDSICVSLESDNQHPAFPSLGMDGVEINPFDGEDAIVDKVERAAWTVYNRMAREIHVESIIARNWPCLKQS